PVVDVLRPTGMRPLPSQNSETAAHTEAPGKRHVPPAPPSPPPAHLLRTHPALGISGFPRAHKAETPPHPFPAPQYEPLAPSRAPSGSTTGPLRHSPTTCAARCPSAGAPTPADQLVRSSTCQQFPDQSVSQTSGTARLVADDSQLQ